MADLNIRTTLNLLDQNIEDENIIITRGATAELQFNLYDKVYKLTDIEQLTFLFKQSAAKQIDTYNMFNTFKPTIDSTPVASKVYYKKTAGTIKIGTTTLDIYEAVFNTTATTYLYEISSDTSAVRGVDSHFFYEKVGNYDWINFILMPNETKRFQVTYDPDVVIFEIAIQIKADALGDDRLHDTYLVETQPGIKVTDSLFGNI